MDDSLPTLGDALYGPNGPASAPQFAKGIDAGKAAPPQQWRGESAAPARPALTPVVDTRSTGANPPATGTSSPEGGPPPFTLPEGMEPHPELLAEYGTAAKELRLDRAGADRLLALHAKATQAATAHEAGEWRKQSEAAFGREELADIAAQFNDAIGTDEAAQEFKQLLSRTGLGNNKSVIQVISRLLRR